MHHLERLKRGACRTPACLFDQNIAVIGVGASGMLFFVELVREMSQMRGTTKLTCPLHLVLIDPGLEMLDNDVTRPLFKSNGSLSIGKVNVDLDSAFILNTPVDELPMFDEFKNGVHVTKVRSSVGEYFNFLVQKAIELVRENNLPLTWSIVASHATAVETDNGKFRIVTEVDKIEVSQAIVCLGSQPNPTPFCQFMGLDQFFSSQFDVTVQRVKRLTVKKTDKPIDFIIAGSGYSAFDAISVLELARQKLAIPEARFRYQIIGKFSGLSFLDMVVNTYLTSSHYTMAQISHSVYGCEQDSLLLTEISRFLEMAKMKDLGEAEKRHIIQSVIFAIAERRNHAEETQLLKSLIAFCERIECSDEIDKEELLRWASVISRIHVIQGEIVTEDCGFSGGQFNISVEEMNSENKSCMKHKKVVVGDALVCALGYSQQGLYPKSRNQVDVDPLIFSLFENQLADFEILGTIIDSPKMKVKQSGENSDIDIPHPKSHYLVSRHPQIFFLGSVTGSSKTWSFAGFWETAKYIAKRVLNSL
ncbi:MAG: hypothetical protein N2654_00490 [Deltaproteobacteria bacterium]|nr:hypothetical protein [Deltaproteobacteria bacterium]